MNESLKTIAITGASGFIGRYVARDFRKRGFSVIGLGRQGFGDVVETDYSYESMVRLLEGAGFVVHLAARRLQRGDQIDDIKPFLQPNVEVLGDLVRACEQVGVSRLVFASTIGVYQQNGVFDLSEDTNPLPTNAYGLSKLMAEQYLRLLCSRTSLDAVALRFSAVFGLGERTTGAVMKFIDLASKGERLEISNPQNVIDQIYVRDAVDAITKALECKEVPDKPVNIGSGQQHTVLEYGEAVNQVFGNEGNLAVSAPASTNPMGASMNIAYAGKVLDWRPQFTLLEGLRDFRRTMNVHLQS